MRINSKLWHRGGAYFLLGLFPLAVSAQTSQLPDAGRILQEVLPDRVQPAPAPLELRIEAQDLSDITPGGAEALVSSIVFEGNEQFSDAELLALLGDEALGRSYDLGGLRELANRISVFYRESGFSFARAFIPVQDLQEEVLLIQVVEGRYGVIEIEAEEARLGEQVQRYLARLQPGMVIEQAPLERVFAILGDVPGIQVLPTIAAGTVPGTGDVLVSVEDQASWGGSLGLDNHGNRFSGAYRGILSLSRPMIFGFGDSLDLTALYSSEDLLLGSIQYTRPLGTSGLRGKLGYSHTDYELGQGADAQGDAKVTTIGLSYPLRRSAELNLTLSLDYQYKDLSDTFAEGLATRATTARVVPLALRFDHRDGLGGGGISFGSVTLTTGSIEREEDLAGDIQTRDSSFTKLNLQLVRMQNLTFAPSWNLYASLSAQRSNTALDSSETMSLGGANGVRAYPQGEASGSQGYITQIELRTSVPPFAPYVFADYGHIPQRGDDEIRRSLAGAGLGVRGSLYGITGDLNVAWKLDAEDATSDTRQKDPRFWFSLSYAF